jgi:hypothetical protein
MVENTKPFDSDSSDPDESAIRKWIKVDDPGSDSKRQKGGLSRPENGKKANPLIAMNKQYSSQRTLFGGKLLGLKKPTAQAPEIKAPLVRHNTIMVDASDHASDSGPSNPLKGLAR